MKLKFWEKEKEEKEEVLYEFASGIIGIFEV